MSLAVRSQPALQAFTLPLQESDRGGGADALSDDGGDDDGLKQAEKLEKILEQILALLMQALDPNNNDSADGGDDGGVQGPGAQPQCAAAMPEFGGAGGGAPPAAGPAAGAQAPAAAAPDAGAQSPDAGAQPPTQGAQAPTAAEGAPAASDGSPSGNVKSWVDQAAGELAKQGIQMTDKDKANMATIAMHESSGDPNAINGWDENAKEGHPSKGLVQTIQSTFDSFKSPGHDDIMNPVDNIMAGFKYAQATYGSTDNVPGIKSLDAGGSYVGY